MTKLELQMFRSQFYNRAFPAAVKRYIMMEDINYALVSEPVEELLKLPKNLKKFHEEYMRKKGRLFFGGEE